MSERASSPVTAGEINQVFGDAPPALPPASAREEWRRIGAFLRRPSLDDETPSGPAFKRLLRIYALDMLVMAALITIAMIVVAAGVELPETAIAGMDLTVELVLLVIIAAPVLEELAFRGWLSGRPGWLLTILIMVGGAVGATFWTANHTGETASAGVGFAILLGVLLSILALVILRKRPAPGWYQTIFPGAFWLSASGFALIHLANFSEDNWLITLPLVIPQLVLGAFAGYARVRIGLWAAMLLHAMHNATALSIAALAMNLGEAAG